MGIFDAIRDSFGGTLADQWKDIVTSRGFNEHMLVAPGIRKNTQEGRGANKGVDDVLSNGSIIFVPENTAAFVFSQGGIEQVVTTPGGFEYRNGQPSVFDEQDFRSRGLVGILFSETAERVGYSGMAPDEKRVAFLNLREIRGIKFGTRGPLVYNDVYYGADLELYAYGTISVQVTDPERVVRNFVPANVSFYTFDDPKVRKQLLAEFLQSFISAVSSLSADYRISRLPSQANAIVESILTEECNAGTWDERFGLRLRSVAIENIELSEESRKLVHQFSEKRMNVRAYEDVSQEAANIAAQQNISEGIRDNGLGDGAGVIYGMDYVRGVNPQNASVQTAAPTTPAAPAETPPASGSGSSLDSQIETLKKLKELLDAGALTQEEFDEMKRKVLGI